MVFLVYLWGFFSALAAPAIAEKTNVAILGSTATEPALSLLTAELSKLPDVQVIERAQLEMIESELHLQAGGMTTADEVRVGQLLHADALLLLTADTTKNLLTLRTMAVAQGVTMSETSYPLPLPEPPIWAGITGRKLAPFFASLGGASNARIPISVLKIRNAGGGYESWLAERDLAFLLSRRLTNEPSLWVLERSQMGLLEWENALKANPQATYWTGSYLLDGSFTYDATGYTVSARLRSAQNGREMSFTAHDKDMMKLVDSLAAQVTASLKVQPAGNTWDIAAEARQYYEEAIWAHRWNLALEATQACDAAWALGMRNDILAILRFTAASHYIWRTIIEQKNGGPVPEATFEAAFSTLDRLQTSLSWKGDDLPVEWLGLSADCLWDCSDVLHTAYDESAKNQNQAEALRTLRQRIRTVSDSLRSANARLPDLRIMSDKIGLRDNGISPPSHGLYTLRAIQGPLWYDDARSGIEAMKVVFDDIDHIANPRQRAGVKAGAILNQHEFRPWIAYWNPAERAQFPFSKLQSALLEASTFPERSIDVAAMLVERRSNVDKERGQDQFEPAQNLAAAVDLEKVIWEARGAIARKEVSVDWVHETIRAIENLERKVNVYASPAIDTGWLSFWIQLYEAELADPAADLTVLEKLELPIEKLTTEQKRDVAVAIRETLQRVKSSRLQRVAAAYEADARTVDGSYVPGPPPRTTDQYVHPIWTATREQLLNGEILNIGPVRWRNGRIYTCAGVYDMAAKGTAGVFLIYDAKTAQTTRLVYPASKGSFYAFSDIEVLGNDIYALSGSKLIRHLAAKDRWEEIAGVTGEMRTRLVAIDGNLYAFGDPGNITRFNPVTGKVDILASSRRRPALTILDDLPPYGVLQVFKNGENRLCTYISDGRLLRYDETKSTWEEINSIEKSLDIPALDRDLFLRAIGPEGMHGNINPTINPAGSLLGLLVRESRIAMEPKPTSRPLPPGIRIPAMKMPKEAQFSALSQYWGQGAAAFDGTDLWILTTDSTFQRTVLKRLPPIGQGEQTIPIEVNRHYGPGFQFVAAPEGIFIFDGKSANFYRHDDLLHWPQDPKPATGKPAN